MTPLDMVNEFTTSRAGIEIKQLLRGTGISLLNKVPFLSLGVFLFYLIFLDMSHVGLLCLKYLSKHEYTFSFHIFSITICQIYHNI